MEQLINLKDKFKQLPDALPGMMKEVFEEAKPLVEDMNIEQLDRGERVDGSSLPNYSPVSVYHYGKRPGPMNLHDKGPFWNGITLVVTDQGIELQGRDIKTEMLQLRYGQVVGLQEGNVQRAEEDILKPEIPNKLDDYFKK
jgi:hypothetical protein